MTMRLRAGLGVLALLAAAGCVTTEGGPPEPAPTPEQAADIAALENAFWYCDYVATTRGVLAAPIAACQLATNELKARKFGGSFRAMTAWWQQRKQAEHERLGREAARSRPPRPGLPNPAAS